MENPALLVRVSRPHGIVTAPAVIAETAGWDVVGPAHDESGELIAPKPRADIGKGRKPRKRAASKTRARKVAATPTDAVSSDSADTPKENA